jgi:hypothetical protein
MPTHLQFLCSGLIDWLETRQMPCLYKSMLGIDCPGCGMQRALIALLMGDLLGSLRLYPALLPTITMLIFLMVHLIRAPQKSGARMLLWMFVLNGL